MGNSLLSIDDEGRMVIAYSMDGRPGGEAIIPAPGRSEENIEQLVEEAKRGFWIWGYYVEDVQRVKNPVFDRERKTSTKLKFRICKNEEEARFVGEKVESIISEAIAAKQMSSEAIERIVENTKDYFEFEQKGSRRARP